jgi:hypothetical protein
MTENADGNVAAAGNVLNIFGGKAEEATAAVRRDNPSNT